MPVPFGLGLITFPFGAFKSCDFGINGIKAVAIVLIEKTGLKEPRAPALDRDR